MFFVNELGIAEEAKLRLRMEQTRKCLLCGKEIPGERKFCSGSHFREYKKRNK